MSDIGGLVAEPPLDGPDRDGGITGADREVAPVFAQVGAHAPRDTGERVSCGEGEESPVEATGGDVVEVGGDTEAGRTAGGAWCGALGEHRPNAPPRTGLEHRAGRGEGYGYLGVVVDVFEAHTGTPNSTWS